jgi:SpoVK/Ycf46/Vps4 family AAA+-type ATPase
LTEQQNANHQNIRKIKDIILESSKDTQHLKSMVVVSSTLCIPTKLKTYCDVIFHELPDEKEIKIKVDFILKEFAQFSKNEKVELDEAIKVNLKGLTLFEVEQAVMSSLYKNKTLKIDDVNTYKKSILKKTDLLESFDTDITFDQVGGLTRLKKWISKRQGIWTSEAASNNIPTEKGLMLVGVTGCGKSLVAKAVGKHWNLPVYNFSPSKIFSSRLGESEARMMKVLKMIEGLAPCVIFLDEIEKQFAGVQSSTFSDAGSTARVIGTFLTWYEEVKAPIFIVSTCNEIRNLPPELISRFDEKFFVPLPSMKDRAKIFDIEIKKWNRDAEKLEINLQQLAERSFCFTGREIMQVVKAALIESWYESREAKKSVDLCQRHLLFALESKVSIQKTMKEELDYLVQWVGWDENKKDGIRANYASEREDDDIDSLFKEILNKQDSNNDKK